MMGLFLKSSHFTKKCQYFQQHKFLGVAQQLFCSYGHLAQLRLKLSPVLVDFSFNLLNCNQTRARFYCSYGTAQSSLE